MVATKAATQVLAHFAKIVVYGAAPMWGYYPTPYPSYYYPYAPGAAMAAGVIWGAAIGAAWSGNHYGWGGGNDININRNTNISTGGNTINRGQGGGQGAQWKSNKQPARGLPESNLAPAVPKLGAFSALRLAMALSRNRRLPSVIA